MSEFQKAPEKKPPHRIDIGQYETEFDNGQQILTIKEPTLVWGLNMTGVVEGDNVVLYDKLETQTGANAGKIIEIDSLGQFIKVKIVE